MLSAHCTHVYTVSCDRLLIRHPTSSIVMMFFLFWSELLLITYASLTHAKLRVNIVTIGNIYPNVPGAIPYTGPAIETGIQNIQSTYGEFFHFTHTYLFDRRMANCVEFATNSDHVAGQWYYSSTRNSSDLVIFLFAGCLEAYPMNRLAAGWNVLMLTSAVNGKILRNKALSPTWITGSCVSLTNYLKLFVNVLSRFKWSSLYIVLDVTANPVYLDLFTSLVAVINAEIDDSQVGIKRVNSSEPTNYQDVLLEFRRTSRVMIFLGHGNPLRNLMVAAAEFQMTNGDHVYIAMEIFENPMFGRFTWQRNDSYDNIARQAYRSVLLLGADTSIYDVPSMEIVEQWREMSRTKFNVSYTGLNPYLMSSYSSVIMLGKALHDAMTEKRNYDFTDGRALAGRFLNRTFDLNFTSMYLDDAGERRMKLAVRSLSASTGNFEVSLLQDPERSSLHVLLDIDWVADDPPPNEPLCGFDGHRPACVVSSASKYYAILGVVFFIVGTATATWLLIRRRSELLKLMDTWWDLQAGEMKYEYQRRQSVWRNLPKHPNAPYK